jgi:DNA ligase-4
VIRDWRAILYNDIRLRDRLQRAKRLLKENGGRVVDALEDGVTHVVMDDEDSTRYKEIVKRTSG